MNYVASLRAALKAAAPVVAVPVEGRAPICIRARLLKGALKGVTIHSVTILDTGALKVTGMSGSSVRTSSTFVPLPRYIALKEIREWSIREQEKRVKQINQGVLSAKEQKAFKLKKAESEWIAELKQAQKNVQSIYQQAKDSVNPMLTRMDEDRREDVISEYRAFRACRSLRKRGSVIRWKIAQARKQLETVTVTKRKQGRPQTFAKSAKHVPTMMRLTGEIRRLESEYKTIVPDVWHPFDHHVDGGYWMDPWIAKAPRVQTCYLDKWYSNEHYNRTAFAAQLKEARATIRALTPPVDETETEPMPIAA